MAGDSTPTVRSGGASGEASRRFADCAALLRAGHPSASDALQRCLAGHADHGEGWCLLGETLADLRQVQAALVCLSRACRSSTTADVALRAGIAFRRIGHPVEARAAFVEAVSRGPGSVRAWFLLGVAAQDAGDPSAAASAYEAALALDPSLGEAALNLGVARQAMADLAGARAAYGRAARLRPDGFARAAQALTTGSNGELWLDLGALRGALARA